MIDIEFKNKTKSRVFGKSFIARVCAASEPYLKLPSGHEGAVGVVMIGAIEMKKLNRERRGVDSSTDVLSFPLHMKPIPGYTQIVLGDLFICPSVVREKARMLHLPIPMQMAWTVAHGLLHLAGYSHTAMRSYEKIILKKLHL